MRYIDELPDGARAQLLAQRKAAMYGDRTAQDHLTVFSGSYWGAPAEDLFDALAVGIGRGCRGADLARRAVALSALFGEADAAEVVRLCGDIHEEIERQAACRLFKRIYDHKASDADLAWLFVQAEAMSDDLIITTSPFEWIRKEPKSSGARS